MKRYILTVTAALTLLLSAGTLGAQAPDYDTYFTPDRLRVDFILAGDAQEQHAYLAGLKKECAWVGSHASLIDPFRYGEYMFEAWSGETLIYSKGFSTLFQEWLQGLYPGRLDAFSQGRYTYNPVREGKGHG